MKKLLTTLALALLCTNANAQAEEDSIPWLFYNGTECSMDYYGVNRNWGSSLRYDIEGGFGVDGWNYLHERYDKFKYRPSNICAQSQHRMVTFTEIDLSHMGSFAKLALSQNASYSLATKEVDNRMPEKLDSYDSAFFDNLGAISVKKSKANPPMLDGSGLYSSMKNLRKEELLYICRTYADPKDPQPFQESVKVFRGEFTQDTSRKAVIEKHQWYDEGTGQFESIIMSISLPAFRKSGEPIYLYVYFPNYFITKSEYTSINGVAMPINYAIIEDLFPISISELMPDSFKIIDEWDWDRGRFDRQTPEYTIGGDKFQALCQITEFMLYQRRNSIYGRGSDSAAEKRFVYVLDKKGNVQGRVTKLYKDGSVLYEANFKDGKPDGIYECFYPDGKMIERGNFKEGKRHGRWTSYFASGRIEADRFYADGKKDSTYQTFFENGKPNEKYSFRKDGTKSIERHYDDGTFMERGEISSYDRAVGIWEYCIKFEDVFYKSIIEEYYLSKLRCGVRSIDCKIDTLTKSIKFKAQYKQTLEFNPEYKSTVKSTKSICRYKEYYVETDYVLMSW